MPVCLTLSLTTCQYVFVSSIRSYPLQLVAMGVCEDIGHEKPEAVDLNGKRANKAESTEDLTERARESKREQGEGGNGWSLDVSPSDDGGQKLHLPGCYRGKTGEWRETCGRQDGGKRREEEKEEGRG
eukprot:757408-Hanusia_phi.AAC.12